MLGGNFSFSNPTGVAVDSSGNVYIADIGAAMVYKMTPNCTMKLLCQPAGAQRHLHRSLRRGGGW